MSDQPRLDGPSPATGGGISSDSATTASSRSRSHFFIWVAVLAVVLVALLHDSLFGGRGLSPASGALDFPPWHQTNGPFNWLLADQYNVFVTQKEFVHQQFWQGHFPLWNPCLDCGLPNLASVQGALLFPVNLLVLMPLGPFYGGGLAAFLKLFLAGWFTMLYLRVLGVSNQGAFLSGLVFSLSSYMIVWLGHPHVNSAMCLPLLLYLIELAFRSRRSDGQGSMTASGLRVWVGFAVVFGCMLLGGHPPTMVHVTLFMGIYFLFRLVEHRRERPWPQAGWLLGAMVLGFLLAAPAIMPYLEYYHYSSTGISSHILQRSTSRLLPNTLILYLFPHLSGSPVEGFEETMLRLGIGKLLTNFSERTGYVGILPLLLALYAVISCRHRLTFFYGLVTLVSLLGVYGVPPLPAIMGALPVLRDVNPTRLILLISFSVATLAGLGWDRFQRDAPGRRTVWVVAGFWMLIGLVLLWLWHEIASRWSNLDAAHRSFLRPQFFMLAGSLVASGVLFLRFLNRRRGWGPVIVLAWVAVDLLASGRGFNPAISRDCYYPTTPAIRWLKQQEPAGFRIFGEKFVLVPNTAQVFGLRDARGYDFNAVRRYEELIDGQAGNFFFYNSAPSLPKPFQLLGVKYVLSFQLPPPDPGLFELVYSNEVTIYRYRAFRERALAVFDCRVEPDRASLLETVRSGTFDPARLLLLEEEPERDKIVSRDQTPSAGTNAAVRIVSDEADEVSLKAFVPQPGFLLLLDTYFPGWTATVNGLSAHLFRADYNFRAVELPAGNSTVRFVYQPLSFRLGVILCLISVLILAAAWFWPQKSRAAESAAIRDESFAG